MVFRLGEISFQPKDSPTSIRIRRGVNLPEQERLVAGPTLQDIGGKLTTIEMDIRLHVSIGPVRERLDAFKALMLSREPKPFINGAGYSEGDFVISDIDSSYEQLDGLGRLIEVQLSVSLKEYLELNSPDAETLAAQKAATATITANPILVNPSIKYQSPKALAMKDITSSVSSAGTAATAAKQVASVPDLAKKNINEFQQALTTARTSIVSAREKVTEIQSEISNAAALQNSLENTLTTVEDSMQYLVDNPLDPDVNIIKSYGDLLDSGIGSILTQSSELATLTTLRR